MPQVILLAESVPVDLLEFFEPVEANKTDVFRISSAGYPGAHFATFPPKLIEPMILAGTSAHGRCTECGAPWRRVVERVAVARQRPNGIGTDEKMCSSKALRENDQQADWIESKTLGWEPGCGCDAEVAPCVVLDPFVGSGTTCATALKLGRRSVGIDLSEKYLRENAVPRISAAARKKRLEWLLPGWKEPRAPKLF